MTTAQVFASVIIAIAVAIGVSAECNAEPSQAADELKLITRSELERALSLGTPITRRTVLGGDISEVLAGQVGKASGCNHERKLIVRDSKIAGDIELEFKKPPPAAGKATSELTKIWLPLEISSSSIKGFFDFSNVNLGCAIDFRGTTFASNVMFANIVFGADVNFSEAIFQRVASFIQDSEFRGRTDFRFAQFLRGATFTTSTIGEGPATEIGSPFYLTEFSGLAVFRKAKFKSLKFARTIFDSGVDFSRAEGAELVFQSATLAGRSNFSELKVASVHLNGLSGFATVQGDAIFRNIDVRRLKFERVGFVGDVDLDGAKISKELSLDWVHFDNDVHLEEARVPISEVDLCPPKRNPSIFLLRDVTFSRAVHLSDRQLFMPSAWWSIWTERRPRFKFSSREEKIDELHLWRQLRRGFEIAGNTELKNYAEYTSRGLAEAGEDMPQRLLSGASRWFWGYGLRPLRVVAWSLFFVVIFAAIFLMQRAGVSLATISWHNVRDSLALSWRTAWRLKFAAPKGFTPALRVAAAVEFFLGKILIACFAYALAQSSPLLSEVLKKLLP